MPVKKIFSTKIISTFSILTLFCFCNIKAEVAAYGAITEKGKEQRPQGGSSEALVKARNILLDNQINLQFWSSQFLYPRCLGYLHYGKENLEFFFIQDKIFGGFLLKKNRFRMV